MGPNGGERSVRRTRNLGGEVTRWHLVAVLLWVWLPLPGFAQTPVSPAPLLPVPSKPEAAPSKPAQEDPYGGYQDDEPQEEAPKGELIPRDSSARAG